MSETSPRLGYRRGGTPQAAAGPVVFLHGVGSSADTWDRVLPLLGGRTLFALDHRGHGRSERPAPPYTLGDFAADTIQFLDALDLQQAHLVGFSLGALVAEAVALKAPERVSSLVLLGAVGRRDDSELARARRRMAEVGARAPSDIARESVSRWFSDEFRAAEPAAVLDEVRIVSATQHEAYAASYAVLVANEAIERVGEIACPTLIMTGAHDEGSTPRMARDLHSAIPHSKLVIIEQAKHYVHIEKAASVSEEIRRFLDSVDAALDPSTCREGTASA